MRKPWLIRTVFAAAVICTGFSVLAVLAEFALYSISKMRDVSVPNLMTVIITAAVCSFLLWEFHYSLTHDSLGRKIKPLAEPIYKKTEVARNTPPLPYIPTPTGRFVFDEDFFFEKMIAIAKRFKLKLSYDVSDYDNEYDCDLCMYDAYLTGKNNFELFFCDNIISITPTDLNVHNCYKLSYSFELFDDCLSDKKAHKYIHADRDFEVNRFINDISVNDLSDDEIFDIIEKIIEALYGASFMEYETIEAEDGKESFIFYLDAPDYYGYSETTEIGNFKFILNKENGGNLNV